MAAARLFVLALLCGLSACASKGEAIAIGYYPEQQAVRVPGAEAITVFVSVSDNRGMDARKVASRYNDKDEEIGAVYATEDVTDIIEQALEQELKARGYSIGANGAQLDIGIERFFNSRRTGFASGRTEADIALNASVKTPSGLSLYQRRVAATGKKPSTMMTGGTNVKLSLENGLAGIIADLMKDEAFLAAIGKAAHGGAN